MSYASVAEPGGPALYISSEAIQAAVRRTAAAARFTLQSVVAGLVVYLMLAGPGLLTDRSSTTAPTASLRASSGR